MKQNLICEKKKKRKRVVKEPEEVKSKDKKVMSDKPKKASGGKRTKLCDVYNNVEDQFICMERAAFFLEHLGEELPKFGKCMLPTNVSYSFWLILPNKFCIKYFPEHDTTITLVDESGKEFKTTYLKVRHGLSAGWKGFTVAQRLLQGDILFFRLIEPCKLQVNIVRRYDLEAIKAADCLMEMLPHVKRTRGSANNFDKEGVPKKEKLKCKKVKKDKVGEPKKEKLKFKEVKKDKVGEPNKEKLKCKEVVEDDAGQLKNQSPIPVQTNKGKRTRRSPKKFISRLSLIFCSNQVGTIEENGERVSCVDQCGTSSDGLGSEVVQGSTSEMTNQSQPDDVGCYNLNLGCHESTADRIFHSSTVAT